MARQPAPDDVVRLADARAAARRAREWDAADELRARIRAAGWKVIDVGTLYDLEPATAPDVRVGEIVRYGSSLSVPSRLDEAPEGFASVVLLAMDRPEDLERAVRALAATAPTGTQLVIVANGESPDQAAALDALETLVNPDEGVTLEIVRTSARLGSAAALNVGIRRATADVVVILDPGVEPLGDAVTPLVAALQDPSVAVAGPVGLVSDDMRRFDEPAADAPADVDAIEGGAMAFRRADYAARGPLDEHFLSSRNLDVWWSLVLRDQGEGEPDDAAPRRAVRVPDLPIRRHVTPDATGPGGDADERLAKKNFYRVLKRFARRQDLLVGSGGASPGGQK